VRSDKDLYKLDITNLPELKTFNFPMIYYSSLTIQSLLSNGLYLLEIFNKENKQVAIRKVIIAN